MPALGGRVVRLLSYFHTPSKYPTLSSPPPPHTPLPQGRESSYRLSKHEVDQVYNGLHFQVQTGGLSKLMVSREDSHSNILCQQRNEKEFHNFLMSFLRCGFSFQIPETTLLWWSHE